MFIARSVQWNQCPPPHASIQSSSKQLQLGYWTYFCFSFYIHTYIQKCWFLFSTNVTCSVGQVLPHMRASSLFFCLPPAHFLSPGNFRSKMKCKGQSLSQNVAMNSLTMLKKTTVQICPGVDMEDTSFYSCVHQAGRSAELLSESLNLGSFPYIEPRCYDQRSITA